MAGGHSLLTVENGGAALARALAAAERALAQHTKMASKPVPLLCTLTIQSIKLALGSKAVPHAKELYARTGDPSYMSFGHQGTRSDTCLLMMKIGSKTVVEGSHSFRVHVFPTPSDRF